MMLSFGSDLVMKDSQIYDTQGRLAGVLSAIGNSAVEMQNVSIERNEVTQGSILIIENTRSAILNIVRMKANTGGPFIEVKMTTLSLTNTVMMDADDTFIVAT